MNILFAFIVTLSIIGFIVGLIKPSWVRMPSRKRASIIFGSVWLVSFILFSITAPKDSSKATPTTVAVATTTQASPSSSDQTPSGSSPTSPKDNDVVYVQFFNRDIVVNFNDMGTDIQRVGADLNKNDYLSAIRDMQDVQTWLQVIQTKFQDLQDFRPLTADVERINTLTSSAITSGLKGASNALADMKNANYDAIDTNAMPYLTTMANDYNKAKQLLAAWQAQNQQ